MTTARAASPRTNRFHLWALGLLSSLLISPLSLHAAERVETHSEAVPKIGADGLIVYCYGPDWNRRSVRMLETFWARPDLMTAAGEAVLLSVPYYERPPTAEELGENVISPSEVRGSLPKPPFDVCPTVMMFDSEGRLYATLVGFDGLGDETGTAGIENIKKNLELLRKRDEMMATAKTMPAGAERSKILIAASELGIAPPREAKTMLNESDDAESKKMLSYFEHDALQFMYQQLDTTDGFLKEDFIEDVAVIRKASTQIFKDENYRPMDRQAAYNLYLGAMRRDGTAGSRLRTPIRNNMKVGEGTLYGKAMAGLVKEWGEMDRVRKTSEQKKALRDKERASKASDRKQDRASDKVSFD